MTSISTVDLSAAHSPILMPHLLVSGLNCASDKPCLYMGDRVVSYAEMRDVVSQMVQAFASLGLGKGSRVAVISANRPEVLFNMAAMSVAGFIGTPLHPLGSIDDHAFVLNDAEVEVLIFDPGKFADLARELKKSVPRLKHLIALGPCDEAIDIIALARTFEPKPLVAPDIAPDDISSVIYTGGTTGRPKGVIHTFRSSAYLMMVSSLEWEFPRELRMLITTPLSHAAAAYFLPVLQRGGAMYVLPGFMPDTFFDWVEKHRITATMIVPAQLYALLDSPSASAADMSSMQTIFYGASAINPVRLQEGIQRWGQIFYQFFGQTEAPMVLANLSKADHDLGKPERLSSCGRPTPWIHLELLDDDNRPVPKGQAGEICVRAPLVMKAYKDIPDQTAEAFAGGWVHTGDIGRFDDEGFLYIVDRKKDMVVTGGFNVFPREIEDVLSRHEAVAQVAVVGVPDERWGEAVKAVVVLRQGFEASDALTVELIESVKAVKGSVQAPKSIDYVKTIPLTAVGKSDKKALRAKYWEGKDRKV